MLVTFESGECGGKDTQAELLSERLIKEGHTVSPLYWEPGSTLKAEVLRLLVKDQFNSDFVFSGDFKQTLDFVKYKEEFRKEHIPFHAFNYMIKAHQLMTKSKNSIKAEVLNFVMYNDFQEEGELSDIIRKLNGKSSKHTPADIFLRKYFTKEELPAEAQLYVYMAARNMLYHNVLQDAVKKFDVVPLNRSIDSSTVYQGHAQNPALLDLIRKLNAEATEGLVPDITFLIDIPIKELMDRKKKRTQNEKYGGANGKTKDYFDEKPSPFHYAVRDGYLAEAKHFASLNPDHREYNRIKVIDGVGTPAEVHERIWYCLIEKINQGKKAE